MVGIACTAAASMLMMDTVGIGGAADASFFDRLRVDALGASVGVAGCTSVGGGIAPMAATGAGEAADGADAGGFVCPVGPSPRAIVRSESRAAAGMELGGGALTGADEAWVVASGGRWTSSSQRRGSWLSEKPSTLNLQGHVSHRQSHFFGTRILRKNRKMLRKPHEGHHPRHVPRCLIRSRRLMVPSDNARNWLGQLPRREHVPR